ncbi:stringent starvation protein B [Methylophilus rhizosphaerae]|uniref:Stringent starvation protein B n=1 Tax=Methylophilus rhizosphaerae TaxID=492660 RepID=A0A1G9DQP1_9PROT|nr:ClpXP protease specificity-enhancing factor [Methylophilus rhizosphaerae]SDK66179.1 stringent starvation protein B [Methylophilus rhizosphaerae]
MSSLIPTTAYLIRAIHEWCVDNALTPHLLVKIDAQTRVPMAYVKNGEIVLNINYTAVKDLHIDNEAVVFSARFNGVAQHIYVPIGRVAGIFARENSQGMFFEVTDGSSPEPEKKAVAPQPAVAEASGARKSHLKVVK